YDPDEYLQAEEEATQLARDEFKNVFESRRIEENRIRVRRFEKLRRKIDRMRDGCYADAALQQQIQRGYGELGLLFAVNLFFVLEVTGAVGNTNKDDGTTSSGTTTADDEGLLITKICFVVLITTRMAYIYYLDHLQRYEKMFKLESAIKHGVQNALSEIAKDERFADPKLRPTLLEPVNARDTKIEWRSANWRKLD
ncbi:unnamed protein product, partial [Amoebophrya sp. A120]